MLTLVFATALAVAPAQPARPCGNCSPAMAAGCPMMGGAAKGAPAPQEHGIDHH
jgi:hypothetical protein